MISEDVCYCASHRVYGSDSLAGFLVVEGILVRVQLSCELQLALIQDLRRVSSWLREVEVVSIWLLDVLDVYDVSAASCGAWIGAVLRKVA